MAILSETEARAILQKVLALSKADECEVTLGGGRSGNLRFARNTVSTSGASEQLGLGVTSSFGKRSGTASINEFDDASLARVVRTSEELARLAPENPEYVELPGPQKYLEPTAYFPSTAGLTQEDRVRQVAASLGICRDAKLVAAGFLSDNAGFSAIGNSRGLFAYSRETGIDFSITARTEDGTGSGYALADFNDASRLDAAAVTRIAAKKAAMSQGARAIEPGKYTVILEPAAASTLIGLMVGSMDARSAEEGRSYLSKAGGGTRHGDKLLDERVHIDSDPLHPEVPGSKWTSDGLPQRRVEWFHGGVVRNLRYSRYWARKKGLAEDQVAIGGGPILMTGTDTRLEDLIKGVKRGVLVTNLWYIRQVDPQTLLQTGLTRDGTFYVEDGEIRHPLKNFRFNESPVIMLNNLEALGQATRVNGNLIPSMVVRDFTFSSLSDA
ncbi:MAG: TldD/PmbA family protein, partial [Limisphaerales bacterium]